MFATLRDPSRFEAWFDRILVNTCRNRLRQGSRQRATDISAEVALATSDPFHAMHDRDLIGRGIEQLSPDQQVVIALRYYRDLSVDEIASLLGVPAGTVHSRLHYALRRLQGLLAADNLTGASR
jgi:RNA polymerase sigma-70 factor (ECF subfamily)